MDVVAADEGVVEALCRYAQEDLVVPADRGGPTWRAIGAELGVPFQTDYRRCGRTAGRSGVRRLVLADSTDVDDPQVAAHLACCQPFGQAAHRIDLAEPCH